MHLLKTILLPLFTLSYLHFPSLPEVSSAEQVEFSHWLPRSSAQGPEQMKAAHGHCPSCVHSGLHAFVLFTPGPVLHKARRGPHALLGSYFLAISSAFSVFCGHLSFMHNSNGSLA